MVNNKKYNNYYYYTFFKICQFAKWINKSDNDYFFSALIALSVLFGLNFLTIYFVLSKKFDLTINPIVAPISIILIVGRINYLFLMKNDKNLEITTYWESKDSAKKTTIIIIYIVLTIGLSLLSMFLTKVS